MHALTHAHAHTHARTRTLWTLQVRTLEAQLRALKSRQAELEDKRAQLQQRSRKVVDSMGGRGGALHGAAHFRDQVRVRAWVGGWTWGCRLARHSTHARAHRMGARCGEEAACAEETQRQEGRTRAAAALAALYTDAPPLTGALCPAQASAVDALASALSPGTGVSAEQV
jgi:hypothetical protein